MAEKVAFRGKVPSELEKLTNEEYAKLIKSRQRRWLKRNSIQLRQLSEKISRYKQKGINKPIKVKSRSALIMPSWIGMQFEIYTGKEHQKLETTAAMLGHRLGEFVYSTKRVMHSAPGIKATRGSKFLSQK